MASTTNISDISSQLTTDDESTTPMADISSTLDEMDTASATTETTSTSLIDDAVKETIADTSTTDTNTVTSEESTTTKTDTTEIVDNTTAGSLPVTPVTVTENILPPPIDLTITTPTAKTAKMGPVQSVSPEIAKFSSVKQKVSLINTGSSNTLTSSTGIIDTSKITSQMQVYLNAYVAANTSVTKPMTNDQKKVSINAFHSIMKYVSNNPIPAVFNLVYNFFKEHKNDIINEKYVLQGIDLLKNEEAKKLHLFYQVFNIVTDTNKRKINLDMVRNIFGKYGDALVNFLSSKM